jgi:hypothetical protein
VKQICDRLSENQLFRRFINQKTLRTNALNKAVLRTEAKFLFVRSEPVFPAAGNDFHGSRPSGCKLIQSLCILFDQQG